MNENAKLFWPPEGWTPITANTFAINKIIHATHAVNPGYGAFMHVTGCAYKFVHNNKIMLDLDTCVSKLCHIFVFSYDSTTFIPI